MKQSQSSNKLVQTVKGFKKDHPDLYEFILFNIMSNVATITNFVVLWISTGVIFSGLSDIPFNWFIFNYGTQQGGLGGFLSFLTAYICAQIVNFIVQRKVVFSATVDVKKVMPWYIATVTVAGLISVWLPPYVIAQLSPYIGKFAPTVANIVNIIIQVLINYPMMKFKIMKKES